MSITDLREAVQATHDSLQQNERGYWHNVFRRAVRSPAIRRLIDWSLPPIDDVTDQIGVSRGRVLTVRLDSFGRGIGHKIPVVGGLLLRSVAKSLRRPALIEGLIDGGNVSTGLALGHFAKKFELRARLVVSRYFPDDMLRYVESASDGRLTTTRAPRANVGREREFYKYLRDIMRDRRKRKGLSCLWHAKYGGMVLRPLGEMLASTMEEMPQTIVLPIGAGATLQGWALPIHERFGHEPRIAVVEHELCPLFELCPKNISFVSSRFLKPRDNEWLRGPPAGIPHLVLGPHYDELNPCIDERVLSTVDRVVRYSEAQWKSMATICRDNGLSVGNSSAVNLLVARFLAEQDGGTILTFIYEPLRDFYKARSARTRTATARFATS